MRVENWDVTFQRRIVMRSAPRIYIYVDLETNTSGVRLAEGYVTKIVQTCDAHFIGEGVAN